MHTSQFEGAEYESVFKDFISKFKFRQFGANIKISSDLLENMYTSQFEGTEYESDIGDLNRHQLHYLFN